MKSIAFFTNKGGVGKTTLMCNLAGYLSKKSHRKILVVDADPQTNATMYMFNDNVIDDIYSRQASYTIHSVALPLSKGKGYSTSHKFSRSDSFGVDVLLGDPRFALIEDTLAADWNSAGVRGLRTTFMFRQFLESCSQYDYVFFDMGPSLGSINRAVLLACDFFVVPISIDIFSLRATENISTWLSDWKRKLLRAMDGIDDLADLEVAQVDWKLKLAGYVSQQYTAKKNSSGERRAVRAYEKIMKQIPLTIQKGIIADHQSEPTYVDYELGTIPNLHSLIPMSQFHRKPLFALKSADGIVGSHFTRVERSEQIFSEIAFNFELNLGLLS
ncbi:ParA family protein [Ancylobacter terrae]|uniref:ParA family protein n=1 Tax=Ancylobacter sp. sgz301288 TaxID=3342077 RepID=UPI0038580F3F